MHLAQRARHLCATYLTECGGPGCSRSIDSAFESIASSFESIVSEFEPLAKLLLVDTR